MDLKKGLLAGTLFLMALALTADWRRSAAAGIADEKGYPQLVESLQAEFAAASDAEKAALSLLVGYCHSRRQDAQAELFWMKKYLQDFRAAAVDLRFLPPGPREKVQAFKRSWQQDFPVLWELAPAAGQAEFAFFSPPAELPLRLQSSLPCEFQILNRDGELLAKGVLGKTAETVRLMLAADFWRTASHHFRLRLAPRSAPEKTIEKYFAVELQYMAPENVLFDPQSAEVKFPGRQLLPESETEKRVISSRMRFDKEYFKKKVLKELLIGGAFFLVDATLLKSTVDSSDPSLFARSALHGTRRVFQLAGIGFSLSALAKLPKAFQRERTFEEKTHDRPEARAANEVLKRDLEQARAQVRVRLSVREL